MAFGFLAKKSQWASYDRGSFKQKVEDAMMSMGNSRIPPLAAIDRLAAMVESAADLNFIMARPEYKRALLGDDDKTNVDFILRKNLEWMNASAHTTEMDWAMYEEYAVKGQALLAKLGHQKYAGEPTVKMPGQPAHIDISTNDGGGMLVVSHNGRPIVQLPVPDGVDLDKARISVNGEDVRYPEAVHVHKSHDGPQVSALRARVAEKRGLHVTNPDDTFPRR